jgi:hypothetical protein
MMLARGVRSSVPASTGENFTLLPFLYFTRTILNTGFGSRKFANDAVIDFKPEIDEDEQGLGLKKRSSRFDRRMRDQARRSTRHSHGPRSHPGRTDEGQHGTTWQSGSTSYSKNISSNGGDYVPFKGLHKASDSDAELEGSTITPSERRAFHALLKMKRTSQQPKSDPDDASKELEETSGQETSLSGSSERSADLDAYLSRVLPEQPGSSPQGRINHWRKVERDNPERVAKLRMEERMIAGLRREYEKTESVKKLMMDATTDVGVWKVFEKYVLEPIKAMTAKSSLDASTLLPEKASSNTAKQEDETTGVPRGDIVKTVNTASTSSEIDLPTVRKTTNTHPSHDSSQSLQAQELEHPPFDLEAIARILGKHAENAQWILRWHYPASPFSLSILPTIRSLGPAASAFLVTDAHYGEHMVTLWRQYRDLSGVLSQLQQMYDLVIPFGEQTKKVILAILKYEQEARLGEHGVSVQRLWKMESKKRDIAKLREWLRKYNEMKAEAELEKIKMAEQTWEADLGETSSRLKLAWVD